MSGGYGQCGPHPPMRSNIAKATTNPYPIVAGVAAAAPLGAQAIRVTGLHLSADVVGEIIFKDGTTAVGDHQFTAGNLSIDLAYNPDGWFQTTPGNALNVANAGGLNLAGWVTYVLL